MRCLRDPASGNSPQNSTGPCSSRSDDSAERRRAVPRVSTGFGAGPACRPFPPATSPLHRMVPSAPVPPHRRPSAIRFAAAPTPIERNRTSDNECPLRIVAANRRVLTRPVPTPERSVAVFPGPLRMKGARRSGHRRWRFLGHGRLPSGISVERSFVPGLQHAADHLAVGQPRENLVLRPHLTTAADHRLIGHTLREAVAALQHGQRAEGFQAAGPLVGLLLPMGMPSPAVRESCVPPIHPVQCIRS